MKRISRTTISVDRANETAFFRDAKSLPTFTVIDRSQPTTPSVTNTWVNVHASFDSSTSETVRQLITRYHRFYDPAAPFPIQEECFFTKAELNSAEALAVVITRAPLAYRGIGDGMEYDWTVRPTEDAPAPWCWQQTPRVMRGSKMPDPGVGVHQTGALEVLIHKRLLDAVKGFNYRRVALGEVIASGSPTDWLQLMAQRVMPPYHPATTGVRWPPHRQAEEPPPTSPVNVYDNAEEGYLPAYCRAAVIDRFDGVPPVTFTWELYGCWVPKDSPNLKLSAPPQSRLIIDQQTRRELIAAGVRRLRYVPIRWID